MKSLLESCMDRSLMKMPLSYSSSGLSILRGMEEQENGYHSYTTQGQEPSLNF